MGRRQPNRDHPDYLVPKGNVKPGSGAKRGRADQLASKIEPFYASGGMSYWLTDPAENFFPIEDGVQLLTTIYVPLGRIGFVKELRVAPLRPAPLIDPWTTSGTGANTASWRDWNRQDGGSEVYVPQMADEWKTPMGWEAAWDEDSEVLPTWRWWLRFYQGNFQALRAQRQNIPPFSTADPSSWYCVPNFPVPASAYSGGIPGNPAGPEWAAQRKQVITGDKMSLHIPIPQDMTVMLFASWQQSDVLPLGAGYNGQEPITQQRVAPIGPSTGSIAGYTQTLNSPAAADNVEFGWGG